MADTHASPLPPPERELPSTSVPDTRPLEGTPPPPGSAGDSPILLQPGQRPLSEYELVRRLGKGGFGEVWQANGPGAVAVALKFVPLGDASGWVELRSLELMKDIRHPHLLPLFGVWQREGFLILAMELADKTLQDRLNEVVAEGREGLPVGEVLEYVREAAKGIDFLNSKGIQHRDIKPPNLLLVGNGVKVADFGLAKLLEHTITTASGAMTPAYAAPEFFENKASSQSDQYCLASTYYRLRTGRLLFEGNALAVMFAHTQAEPDLSQLPEAERPALQRALAKGPLQRWPNCRAFVDALAAAVASRQTD